MNPLIVGAGPTGLTAALEMLRLGLHPTIVDRRESASTLSRAVGITPYSLQLLSRLGVAEKLIAEGIAMDGLRVYKKTKLVLSLPLYSEKTYYPSILGLAQDRTESIMADALAKKGVQVQYGLALEGFEKQGDKVSANFSDGSVSSFDRIIGADGVKSTTRDVAGIAYTGINLPQTWSIADVDAQNWRHRGKITLVCAGPAKVVVVAPLSESRYRVVASHENALQALPLPMDVTNIRREATFKISIRQAETYSKGCVHIAGDAAHCHSPVGGRGMNLGITDAIELANCLAENRGEDYSSTRHREGGSVIKMTERGRAMTSGVHAFARIRFSTLLAVANAAGPFKKRLGRFLVEF